MFCCMCVVSLAVIVPSSVLYLLVFKPRPVSEIRQLGKAKEPVEFNLGNVHFARISGFMIKVIVKLLDSFLGNLVLAFTRRKSNLDVFERLKIVDPPTFFPIVPPDEEQIKTSAVSSDDFTELINNESHNSKGFQRVTLSDLALAYRAGTVNPVQVAERAIQAIEATERHSPPLRWMVQWDKVRILQMAANSAARFATGQPLSIVDGIPVVIKEEYAVIPFHARHGTQFLGEEPTTRDSTIVAKLREGGAVILGVTNMHELGLGITGNNCNKLHGVARNPYNINHYPGGSSSGVATSVVGGLAPIGLGTDAGGSVRIPSSFSGCVGLKATFGRISVYGEDCPCPTIIYAGPMCATVRDTALVYGFLAGPDPLYPEGLIQPPVTLRGFENVANLEDIRLGIDWSYFKFADAEVVNACKKAVDQLQDLGAKIVPIQIPELEEARVAHIITILTEMSASLKSDVDKHGDQLNPDTLLNLVSAGKTFKSTEYFQAQKQRTRSMGFLKEFFKTVDCILTPSTAITAPAIRQDALTYGEIDQEIVGKTMSYTFLTNLTGNPSLVVPVGYDAGGLPISLQLIGAWWNEHVILRLGHAVETSFIRRKPQVHFSLLE